MSSCVVAQLVQKRTTVWVSSYFSQYSIEACSRNAGHVLVGQNHKLLVCGRLQEELVAALVQHTTQRLRGFDRLTANLKIQAIGKECLKLDARQVALASSAPCCLIRGMGCAGACMPQNTTASPHSAPHLVPPM